MKGIVVDEGFVLGDAQVYPLDFEILTPFGKHDLSPIAMELLCELARANGKPVSSEHLVSQIWGARAPDEGTIEHYVAELNYELAPQTNGSHAVNWDGDAEGYCLSLLPKPLPMGATHSGDSPGTPSVELTDTSKDGFFEELRKRKVSQTGVLYLVASWLILQFTDVTFSALGLGDEIVRLILITVVIGFPITLVLAWFYDVKPANAERVSKPTSQGAGYVLVGALIAIPIAFGYQWFYIEDLTADVAATVAVSEAVSEADIEHDSIAVLAFSNLGGDQSYNYFGDGVAEEILNALSSTKMLLVAPRTSSFLYKDTATDIKNIGKQLGVRYVLEGSVRRVGERVRVIVTLIDITTGFQAWSNSYDQAISNIFDVQQDISKKVVQALNIVLSAEKNEALGAARTSNVEAFDYYLQGRDYLNRPVTQASLTASIRLFNQSIEVDPQYSDAYAGLCESYLQQYTETDTSDWYTKAENTCKETLRFDLKTVEMRIALGNLYRQSGRFDSALLQLNIAVDKAPDNIDALSALAKTYANLDNWQKAEELFLRAISVQPRFWKTHEQYGIFLFDTGRPEQAIEYYQLAIEMTPDSAAAYNNLGAALLMSNRFQEAANAFKESLYLEDNESASSNAGTSLFLAGEFDEAAEMYVRAIGISKDQHTLWGNLADAQRFGSTPQAAQKSYKKAITLAEQSLAINANDRVTAAALSHYYSNVNKRELAKLTLEKAIADNPPDLYVWYYASLTWLTLDKKGRAVQSLHRAIELGYPKPMVLSDAGLKGLTSKASYRSELGL